MNAILVGVKESLNVIHVLVVDCGIVPHAAVTVINTREGDYVGTAMVQEVVLVDHVVEMAGKHVADVTVLVIYGARSVMARGYIRLLSKQVKRH